MALLSGHRITILAMLLVVSVVYLLHWFLNADAAPLSVIFPREASLGPSLAQECVCPETRSKWDIVRSCLVTIFACSWVSVHPNIPGRGTARWKKALWRVELMFWSIFGPEFNIYWAATQWLAAQYLAHRYGRFGWTKTHGYFIQMGGFMLYDGDQPVGVLGPEKLQDLFERKKIDLPKITEEEILDRSKGDGLSKTLVIIQTTWFIVKCIARRVRGLVITELELVTLALATLNVVMYAFWWNKPLNVQTTVPVHLLQPTTLWVNLNPCLPNTTGVVADEAIPHEASSDAKGNEIPNSQGSWIRSLDLWDLGRQAYRFLSGILFRWPAIAIIVVWLRIGNIMYTDDIREGQMRVNTFYAYSIKKFLKTPEAAIIYFALPVIGILLGAIHCAGWNFFFPSLIEANIWRVCSALSTIIPTIGLVQVILDKLSTQDNPHNFVKPFRYMAAFLLMVMFPVYVFARLALLVEAFISLRDLPPGAFAVVEWTSFIPHL